MKLALALACLTLAATQPPSDTVRATRVATIGEMARTPFLIGEVSGLALDDAGGRELRRFGRAVAPVRIPGPERAESLRAFRRRADSIGVPISEVRGASEEVRAGRLPNVYPTYRGVVATPAGDTWVRRWSPAWRWTGRPAPNRWWWRGYPDAGSARAELPGARSRMYPVPPAGP